MLGREWSSDHHALLATCMEESLSNYIILAYTLQKMRWILELSARPVISLLSFHLLQTRDGTRETLIEQGGCVHLNVEEGVCVCVCVRGGGGLEYSPLSTYMSMWILRWNWW